jgi:hypothetical protein
MMHILRTKRFIIKMNNNIEYDIVKIPLTEEDRKKKTHSFIRMPVLYLELLENKSKVKPNLLKR